MEITHEIQGSNTYLVCKLSPEEKIDSSILGMLTNNHIDGIAQTIYTQIDDIRILKYNITAKLSVSQIVDSPLTKKRILTIFSEILSAVRAAEEYMIYESSMLINKDYIFTDVATNKTELICLPVVGFNIETKNIPSFFKSILFNAKFEQSENSEYVTQLINFLNTNAVFSAETFYQMIQKLMIEKIEPVKKVTSVREEAPVRKKEVPPVLKKKTPQQVEIPEVKGEKPPVKAEPKKDKVEETADEKPMSLFYLLQHYNSDNKRIYDEQKAKKKGGGKKPEAVKKAPEVQQKTPGFAIPGQIPTAPASVNIPKVETAVTDNKPVKEEVEKAESPKKEVVHQQRELQFDFSNVNTSLLDELDDDEGTVVIGNESETGSQQATPYLFRFKTNERIYINKPIFKIGRNSDIIDYDIRDNKHIGHCHCHILIREDGYYIMDDNSRNHTYVDNEMLVGGIEVSITQGQSIRIADEEFEFRLY